MAEASARPTARYEVGEPGSMVFHEPVQWFVYRRVAKHVWRFACACVALTGEEAMLDALEEGGDGQLMAVPAPAAVTLDLEIPDAFPVAED